MENIVKLIRRILKEVKDFDESLKKIENSYILSDSQEGDKNDLSLSIGILWITVMNLVKDEDDRNEILELIKDLEESLNNQIEKHPLELLGWKRDYNSDNYAKSIGENWISYFKNVDDEREMIIFDMKGIDFMCTATIDMDLYGAINEKIIDLGWK
jgi:hypothetical protein